MFKSIYIFVDIRYLKLMLVDEIKLMLKRNIRLESNLYRKNRAEYINACHTYAFDKTDCARFYFIYSRINGIKNDALVCLVSDKPFP